MRKLSDSYSYLLKGYRDHLKSEIEGIFEIDIIGDPIDDLFVKKLYTKDYAKRHGISRGENGIYIYPILSVELLSAESSHFELSSDSKTDTVTVTFTLLAENKNYALSIMNCIKELSLSSSFNIENKAMGKTYKGYGSDREFQFQMLPGQMVDNGNKNIIVITGQFAIEAII